jgi:RHS repeat-associated protein
MRITAGAALAAMLVGPLRMASATPAPPAPSAQTSSGSRTSPAPTKLPTDLPWALATAVRPARIKVLAGAVEESALWRLFDGRAATGLASDGRVVRFRAEFSQPTYFDAIAVFGKVAGALSVEVETSDGPKSLMQSAGLAGGGARWNRRDFAGAPLATAVLVAFEPSAPSAVLPEIELWGRPASAAPSTATASFPDALYAGVPQGARELRAPQGEQTISPATVSAPGVGGTFTLEADGDPAGFDRAFLVYELSGQPHFTAAARSVNGARTLGRFGVARGAKGGLQVEEISPASLQKGRNRIQFFPADERSTESYRVSNVRVVVVPRAETTMTDASARDASALRDGREATGWRVPASQPADTRRWEFASATQPWGLDLRLPGPMVGTLTVASASGRDKGQIAITLDGLGTGWHRVPLDKLPPTNALTLRLAAGKETAAAISELAIEGSPLPADVAPRLSVTYPLSAECVNHRVHVRGFVAPADAEAIYFGGRRMDGALGRDGAFAFELGEKDAAGQDVIVEAKYPGGARARRAVSIGRCIERPPAVVTNDGRPRQPAEDLGAPYGVTVKAGQAASLSFAGVKLDIPPGAVDKDVRLTVRPLPANQVAPLDAGMTNISPEAQAFRFGPHGMVFKKPISVTLPYSKKLIPTGYTAADVRTFYYNEDLHRWEQVALVAQNDGEMVSVTEHFTDFINATIAMPEHPGTQSLNPTSLKDIKLADPAAGIAQIEPPAANSTGAANLRVGIEAPPGRRGLQPDLAIAYSSSGGGDGWLGVGWNLEMPSIMIDTRFGVPRYDADGRSETYLLNGEMLTRLVDAGGNDIAPTGAPPVGPGTVYFARRVEGKFDWIARLNSLDGAGDYSWQVTDKNGVIQTYGATAAARLASGGHTFRWHLQSLQDRFGNTMTYEYRTASGTTAVVTGSGNPWVQIYPQAIRYTCAGSTPVQNGIAPTGTCTAGNAAYSIVFRSAERGHIGFATTPVPNSPYTVGTRPDVQSSARAGFEMQTRELLDEVEVREELGPSSPQTIRRYHLFYETGEFGKTRLKSIGVYGPAAVSPADVTAGRFYEHAFTYFASAPHGFGAATQWLDLGDNSRGLTDTDNSSGGGNAFIGVGPPGCTNYFGGGGGFSLADDDVEKTLADLNGDGLPDIVANNGNVSFVQFADGSRTTVQTVSSPAFNRDDLSSVGCAPLHDSRFPAFAPGLPLGSTSQTTATINAGVHLFGFAGGSATGSFSWGSQGQEFADFDGDGLPDVISTCGGAGVKVAQTRYDSSGALVVGAPSASSSGLSALTASDVVFDPTSSGISQAEISKRLHPVSPLVSWTAPFTGHVVITGNVQRDPLAVGTSNDNQPPGSVQEDGVVASIDRAVTVRSVRLTNNLWTRALTTTDPCAPSGTGDCSGDPVGVDISAGDRLYFHVDPGSDTHGDTTRWSPTISYSCLRFPVFGCLPLTDAQKASTDNYGLPRFTYNLGQDFRTIDPAPPPFFASVPGFVTVTVTASGTATHDLTLRVLKNGARLASGGVFSIPQGTTGPQTYSVGPIAVDIVNGSPDQIVIEADYSEAQVDPGAFQLFPRVDYNQVCELFGDPNATVPDCRDVTCVSTPTGQDCRVAGTTPPLLLKPDQVIVFPEIRDSSQSNDPPAGVDISADGSYVVSGSLTKKSATEFPVTLAVFSDKLGTLFEHVLDPAAIADADLPQDMPAAQSFALTDGDRITAVAEFQSVFDVSSFDDPFKVVWNVKLTTPDGTVLTVPVRFKLPASGEEVRMMGGFRDWRYGEWNADRAVNGKLSEAILLSRPSQDQAAEAAALLRVSPRTPRLPSIPAISGIPASTPVIVRETPDGRQQFTQGVWLGAGPDSFITAGAMKPSRVGGVDPDRAALGGPDTLRKTFTSMAGFDAVAVGSLAISNGSTVTRQEFLDLNGDRRPDSVAYNRATFFDDRTGQYGAGSTLGMPDQGSLRLSNIKAKREGVVLGSAASALVGHVSPESTTLKALVSVLPSLEHNSGHSNESADFLDVNGDGLPDHVRLVSGAPQVQINLGYGFGPEIAWPMPADPMEDCSPLSCQKNVTNSLQVGFAGLGGGVAYSASVTSVRYIDVNGDGLPDRLTRLPESAVVSVDLNMGTYFTPDSWSVPAGWPSITLDNPVVFPSGGESDALELHETKTINAGAGIFLPINIPLPTPVVCLALEFSAQISGEDGTSEMRFEDMNGDGQPDQVLKLQKTIFRDDPANAASKIFVKLNSTTGKENLLKTVSRPLGGTIAIDYSREGNHVDRTIAPLVDMPRNQWVMTSVTVDDGRGNSYTSSYDYSAFGASGPLSFGSGFYERDEREDLGYGHVHVVRSAVDFQGNSIGDGSQVDTFYLNQDFYRKGFLQAEFESDASGKLIGGSTVTYAVPQDALLVSKAATDAARLAARQGSFFPKEQERRTLYYEKAAGFSVASVMAAIRANPPSAPPAPKFKVETRQFDNQGNIIDLVDAGDEQLTTDDLEYKITYFFDAGENHITRASEIDAFPPGNPSAFLRKRLATYNAGTGTIATLTNIVSGGKVPETGTPGTLYNQASAIYNFTYDTFGNMRTSRDPTGYTLQYTYDTTAQTYRTRVDDLSFGYFSTATYDLRFGAVSQSSDVNGQPETFAYDTFGRLCTVRGPDDQTASEPTIAMSYGVIPSSCPNPPPAGSAFPAYAVTRHKDVQHAGNPIDTVAFVDGLGRAIQTKKDLDRDAAGNGSVTTGMTVSGQVLFDGRGRVRSQAQPGFSQAGTTAFVAAGNASNPTTFAYDELGRQTSMNVPDGTAQGIQTTTAYSIVTPTGTNNLGDGRSWLATGVTDANENIRLSYADGRGNRIAVREFNTVGTSTSLTTLTTRYAYDPLDQLVTVTDAKENATSAVYDTAGQMVTLTNADAGQTEFRFDLNGNLKEKQTAVLRAASQTIKYLYDFNRLKQIDYPTSPDVFYSYGGPTEKGNTVGNLASRIKQVTFDNGNELRFYDSMGNVRESRTTLNRIAATAGVPPSITFKMKYTYDWLGRMQTMTFPNWLDNQFNFLPGEGELVSYFYDSGGSLDKVTGHHQTGNPIHPDHPTDFTYLSHIGYDEFQQRTVLVSGNGIANIYGYEPETRRMSDVKADTFGALEQAQGLPPSPFHRIHYTYDKVGNILQMVNNVSVQFRPDGVFIGPLDVTYTYDDLYQIRSLSGKYRARADFGYQYSDTYTYDELGNIKTKAQSEDRLIWPDKSINTNDPNPVVTQLGGSRFDHNVGDLTYSISNEFSGSRPHAASAVTETLPNDRIVTRSYSYDENGNNAGNTFKGDKRGQIWDEENRLKEVTRNGGSLAQFKYDDTGERRKKRTNAGDSWYVNQFFVLLPNGMPTKHIFAGETRVVSKTDAITMTTPVISYYHSDNVGSTSYTSGANQDLLQHDRYFAFGEPTRQGNEGDESTLAHPDNIRRDWLFASKELDVDTSLYYFGARYFDPHADVWQSTDPILANYMRRGPSGASPKNLGLYSYGWNNPIVMRDPDGRKVKLSGDKTDLRDLIGTVNERFTHIKLSRDKGGFMHILRTRKGKLSPLERGFLKVVGGLINDKKHTVKVGVVRDRPTIMIGSYPDSAVDAGDFKRLFSGAKPGDPPMSAPGILTHELVEQFQKQFAAAPDSEYEQAHKFAISQEEIVEGQTKVHVGNSIDTPGGPLIHHYTYTNTSGDVTIYTFKEDPTTHILAK